MINALGRLQCDFCPNDELGPTDYTLLSDGKIYCWRCDGYYYKNGEYVPKNTYGKKKTKI